MVNAGEIVKKAISRAVALMGRGFYLGAGVCYIIGARRDLAEDCFRRALGLESYKQLEGPLNYVMQNFIQIRIALLDEDFLESLSRAMTREELRHSIFSTLIVKDVNIVILEPIISECIDELAYLYKVHLI